MVGQTIATGYVVILWNSMIFWLLVGLQCD